MEDGNEHRVVVWLADTAIVKKPLTEQGAVLRRRRGDGQAGAEVQRRVLRLLAGADRPDGNRYRVNTQELRRAHRRQRHGAAAGRRGATGATSGSPSPRRRRGGWLTWASAASGPASTTTSSTSRSRSSRSPIGPSIGPGRRCTSSSGSPTRKFDQPDASPFAAQSFLVEIHDPRGEKVYSQSLVADALRRPRRRLGSCRRARRWAQYQLTVVNHGGGSFRVEEYKKPEYEVTIDAPSEAGEARRQDHGEDHARSTTSARR